MEMTFTPGWKAFKRRIFINTSVERVYQAWAQSGELEHWFFESADYLDADAQAIGKSTNVQTGNTCSWKWYGWPHLHTGKILSAVTNESLKFDFNPGGIVEIQCIPVHENRTELILHQTEIPDATEQDNKYFYYGCSLGWSFWMLNLKAWLEHGIVLNEKTNPYPEDPRKLELVNH